MTRRAIVIIIARARDGTIAKDGDVPWKISGDLKRFKAHDHGPADDHGAQDVRQPAGPAAGPAAHRADPAGGLAAPPGAEVAHTVDEALGAGRDRATSR